MPDSKESPSQHTPRTEEQIRDYTIGELSPLNSRIVVAEYDPRWPALFHREAERIGAALGERALCIEHTGSTAVAGLPAKPIIDILLVVSNSANENAYVPDLERAGYILRIREESWHEHRMFNSGDSDVNLHVFSAGCPEIERIIAFRDWLRSHSEDRDLYASVKRSLAQQEWKYVQNYADAKTRVVEEILARAIPR